MAAPYYVLYRLQKAWLMDASMGKGLDLPLAKTWLREQTLAELAVMAKAKELAQ